MNAIHKIVLRATVFSFLCISPCIAGQTEKVFGKVTDEQGEPLAGVKWRISGIEELHDGHWVVVFRLGWPEEHTTDEDGRFVIEFRENIRYDLQFDRWGYGQVFLYQISSKSPEINVVMKEGIPICGSVTRLADGILEPVIGTSMVELRLPNPRGNWYKKQLLTDHEGKFKCFASPPPQPPTESHFTCNGKVCSRRSEPAKWQVVCAGEIVQIDVEEGKEVDDINFEVQVRVTRGGVQQPAQSTK